MSKIKKFYCVASVVFAVFVLLFTIAYTFSSPMTVYAAEQDGDANYGTDGIDGIHITVDTDSEDGTLSAPIRILLLLTIISIIPGTQVSYQ